MLLDQLTGSLAILSPLILLLDLSLNKGRIGEQKTAEERAVYAYLFFRSKVVHNVKKLANFLRGLALDHVGDGLTADITGQSRVNENSGTRGLILTAEA